MPLSPAEYDEWSALKTWFTQAAEEWGPDLAEDDTQALFWDAVDAISDLASESAEIRLGADEREAGFASFYSRVAETVAVARQRAIDLGIAHDIPTMNFR